MNTTNQKLINEIYFNIPILSEKISNGFNKYYYYLDILKDEQFEEKKNETEEDAIKRAESFYDRLDEMIKRNELSNNKALETIEILKKMTDLFYGIVNNTENEKEKLTLRNNELIDIIIDLERRKTNKLISQNPRKNIIDLDEIQQIEEWSGMKMGNIIFDSNIYNWKVSASVFGQKIKNKSNLIFLIEDDDNNKFGGYVNAKIDKIDRYITDSKLFLFSLKSNGRLNGMLKFHIKRTESQYAFYLFNQSDHGLFSIGFGDIHIYKENNKNKSYCNQKSFNYNGIKNALCGKEDFKPKRITVIQLI